MSYREGSCQCRSEHQDSNSGPTRCQCSSSGSRPSRESNASLRPELPQWTLLTCEEYLILLREKEKYDLINELYFGRKITFYLSDNFLHSDTLPLAFSKLHCLSGCRASDIWPPPKDRGRLDLSRTCWRTVGNIYFHVCSKFLFLIKLSQIKSSSIAW